MCGVTGSPIVHGVDVFGTHFFFISVSWCWDSRLEVNENLQSLDEVKVGAKK